ncbi:hypothetical protein [Pelagibacterium mangrovi]|uniref:hypothetical protein n=1 Tax=Pelagibacterium mangrovi TaxID=3119828 RepID=UPI002FC78C28
MKYLLLATLAATCLAACGPTSNVNHSVGSLQFNGETEPYPEDYAEVAAQMVRGRDAVAPLTVSEPQTMRGEGPFSPKRWFVCVRGVKPVGNPTRAPLQRQFEDWVAPPASTGNYDVILVFRDKLRPAVVEGHDARLCRFVEFNPLPTEL